MLYCAIFKVCDFVRVLQPFTAISHFIGYYRWAIMHLEFYVTLSYFDITLESCWT